MREVTEIETLVHQTILWVTGKPIIGEQHYCLSRLTEVIVELDDPVLTSHVKKLPIEDIEKAVNKVFDDHMINWGRVVALFAFCAKMALLHKDHPGQLKDIEARFTLAIFSQTAWWIEKQGGWQNFLTFASSEKKNELLPWTLFGVCGSILIYIICKS